MPKWICFCTKHPQDSYSLGKDILKMEAKILQGITVIRESKQLLVTIDIVAFDNNF